jgi:hypothetical protein
MFRSLVARRLLLTFKLFNGYKLAFLHFHFIFRDFLHFHVAVTCQIYCFHNFAFFSSNRLLHSFSGMNIFQFASFGPRFCENDFVLRRITLNKPFFTLLKLPSLIKKPRRTSFYLYHLRILNTLNTFETRMAAICIFMIILMKMKVFQFETLIRSPATFNYMHARESVRLTE